MTRKQAEREAKKFLGRDGVVEVILRSFKPFKVGIRGPFAVDWRGEGDNWAEAFQALRLAEEKALMQRKLDEAARCRWSKEVRRKQAALVVAGPVEGKAL